MNRLRLWISMVTLLLACPITIFSAPYVHLEQVGRWWKRNWNFTEVALQGNLLAIAAGTDGWHLLNVSNPAAPVRIYTNAEPALDLKLSANHLLLRESQGIRRYDLSDPFNPQPYGPPVYLYDTMAATFRSGAEFGPVFIANNFNLYLADEAGVISSPVIPGGVHDMVQQGSYLYGVGKNGLRIYREGATGWTKVGAYEYGQYHFVRVSGTRLFMGHKGGLIETVDITDPKAPDIIGTVTDMDTIASVSVAGTRLYASAGLLHIFDFSSGRLRGVGRYHTPGTVHDAAANNTFVYAADGTNGIVIYRQSVREAPMLKASPLYSLVTGDTGKSIELTVSAEGLNPDFEWYRLEPYRFIGTGSRLTVTNVSRATQGKYLCYIRDQVGDRLDAHFDVRVRGGLKLEATRCGEDWCITVSTSEPLDQELDARRISLEWSHDFVIWNRFASVPIIGPDGIGRFRIYPSTKPTSPVFYRIREP
jgi:hypothetical protein